ncbi:MAG: cytochrome c3 family protein [Desulfobacterales bacterium]|nr:cytochrome c3 family protein [Desulfobacterales bacterium]
MRKITKRQSISIVIIVFFLVVIFLLSTTPGKVGAKKQRSSVPFNHEQHMSSLDCLDCHHQYDEKRNNILDTDELQEASYENMIMLNTSKDINTKFACASCHNEKKTDLTTTNAFHEQCIGCHDQKESILARKKDQKKCPILCGECHIRQSKST